MKLNISSNFNGIKVLILNTATNWRFKEERND